MQEEAHNDTESYANPEEEAVATSPFGMASRRSLAVAPVAAATVALLASTRVAKANADTTQASKKIIQIKSPKDATIFSIAVQTGARLNEGDVVCVLDTNAENQMVSRINSAKQLVQLDQASMSPDKVALRRDILQQSLTVSQAYFTYANTNYTDLSGQYAAGFLQSKQPVLQATAALARATSEVDKANSSLKLFDDNVTQTNLRLSVLASQLDSELQSIQNQIANATIRMPTTGVIILVASKNIFVEKGELIAEVEPQ